MNNDNETSDMNAAMAFLVDKLKSGKANVSDLGVILADTYRQTDHQSKVLEQQTKNIHILNTKMDDLEPAVKSLLEDQKRARWAVRGVVSFVSAFGLVVGGWVYTQGHSIAYALSLDEQKIRQVASYHSEEVKKGLEEKMRIADAEEREWIDSKYQRKP
jgi:hypothetical protein